ncbi:MAG: V-type ATP synthase subunit D [Chlamydiia bacterium]|nr:V-type ATP synthase subunit D [Chlamydiia bacterium]
MAEFKLTKTELREQQNRLKQLTKYLPTLQLKKAMLQLEISDAKKELSEVEKAYDKLKIDAANYAHLLKMQSTVDLEEASRVKEIKKRVENIAGIEVPYFDEMTFEPYDYSLLDTPAWVDSVIVKLKGLKEAQVKIEIAIQKKEALEEELRQVSIRVNLFEKILIPRAKKIIKKIKVFLGDQELAAVSRAKVAKSLIEEKKLHAR